VAELRVSAVMNLEDAAPQPETTPQENEARVLSFRREKVHQGVHVATVGLRRSESSLMHFHPATRDTFYVMEGRLTVTIVVEPTPGVAPYQSFGREAVRIEALASGGEAHKVSLTPGEVLIIEPGVVHCAANLDQAPCHFLCVEGVGVYDFVQPPSPRPPPRG
jgi:quercetin dioxygenase-like cupin family protein